MFKFHAAMLMAAAGSVFGGLIQPDAFTATAACVDTDPLQCLNGAGPLNGSLNTSVPVGGGTFSYTESGTAVIKGLKASAYASFNGAMTPAEVLAVETAGFVDVLTISSPLRTGQTGYLDVQFELDGTISQSGSFTAGAAVTAQVNNQSQAAVFTSSTSGMHVFPGLLMFAYGTPFNIQLLLQVGEGTFDFAQTGYFVPPQGTSYAICRYTSLPGSGAVDFSNSFDLGPLLIFDAQMNQITNVSLTSASGTQYAVATPEPSMMIPVLMVLAWAFVGRKHTARGSGCTAPCQ